MPRALLAVLLLGAAPLHAQTNDHFFRSWSWGRDEGDARAAALGGASLALADDSVLARVNPAGLPSLSRPEISVNVLRRATASTAAGDTLSGGVTLGSFTAGARVGSRWTAGLYATDARHARITMDTRVPPDELIDRGSLEIRVREAGVSTGIQIAPGLYFGGRLGLGYASAEGEYRRDPPTPTQLTRLIVTTSGSDARLTGGVSAVWEPTSRLRLAGALDQGNAWTLERKAQSPWLGADLDTGSAYRLRQPSALRGGAALRLSHKVQAVAQVDRVRYSEIQSVLIIRQGAHAREDYQLADAWEPRGGLEVSVPFRTLSLQLRAGVERPAPGALAYEGGDPVEQETFTGMPARFGWTAGGSLVTGSLRLHVAARGGADRGAVLAGLNLRF